MQYAVYRPSARRLIISVQSQWAGQTVTNVTKYCQRVWRKVSDAIDWRKNVYFNHSLRKMETGLIPFREICILDIVPSQTVL